MDYNLENIRFTHNKKKSYKISYCNYKKYSPIFLTIPNTGAPFGIENYSFKDIVNIELNHTINNDLHNVHSALLCFDTFFSNLCENKYISQEMRADLQGKKYISCLKQKSPEFSPLLRTHLKKNGNNIQTIFYKNVNNARQLIPPYSIKNKLCRFVVVLDSLWFTDDSFGLFILLNLCETFN